MTTRLALISDQHGNDAAFRAALADVERLGVDEIVCLGDVAQGGSEPAQTLDRLAALGCETVLGNADAFLLEVPADSPEPVTERQLEVREWTLLQLGPWHLEQIRSFVPVCAGSWTACPCSSSTARRPPTTTCSFRSSTARRSSRSAATTPRCSRAGTRISNGRAGPATRSMSIPAASGSRTNRHADPPVLRALAEWALVTVSEGAVSVEFRQVPYAVDDVRAAARQSGRPHADEWAAQWESAPA